jgi:CMP-N-acetylneuraminic acid synthetase
MSSMKSLVGQNPYLYKLDETEGLDINSKFEFSYANYLYKKKHN